MQETLNLYRKGQKTITLQYRSSIGEGVPFLDFIHHDGMD